MKNYTTRKFEMTIFVNVPDENNPSVLAEMPVTFIVCERWHLGNRTKTTWDFVLPYGASETTLKFIEIEANNIFGHYKNDARA